MGDVKKEQILLSWVSNYAYCPRRFYLATIEAQKPQANIYMTEGTIDHTRVDRPKIEKRGPLIKVTRLQVISEQYNLYGICDNVEFMVDPDGAWIPFLSQTCRITPVEYKHGKPKEYSEYKQQLTAQAMCMEEMYNTKVDRGFLYYTSSRQRQEVVFDEGLRDETIKTITNIREALDNPTVIRPEYKRRCQKCAYFEICEPKKVMVNNYVSKLWGAV